MDNYSHAHIITYTLMHIQYIHTHSYTPSYTVFVYAHLRTMYLKQTVTNREKDTSSHNKEFVTTFPFSECVVSSDNTRAKCPTFALGHDTDVYRLSQESCK